MDENKPGEIDTTGATLSPAQIAADQKKEAEEAAKKPADIPAEKKPEEKPADTPVVPPADEKTPVEPKPAAEPPVEPEPTITKPRTIYQDHKETKEKLRDSKSEVEKLNQQIADKDTEIANLKEKAEKAETPAEKKEVTDEIAALAEELGTTPEQMSKLADFINKKVQPAPVAPVSPLSEEDKSALARIRETEAKTAAAAAFKEELSALAPKLKEEFPSAPDADMTAVTAEIDRLAHTTQYHDKPLAYILWENKAKLEKLVSPKRPSIGDGGATPPAPPAPVQDETDYSENVTPAALSKPTTRAPSTEIRKSA